MRSNQSLAVNSVDGLPHPVILSWLVTDAAEIQRLSVFESRHAFTGGLNAVLTLLANSPADQIVLAGERARVPDQWVGKASIAEDEVFARPNRICQQYPFWVAAIRKGPHLCRLAQ